MEADWFSDDDLDQLPDTTLLALEQSAISSTQKQPVTTALPILSQTSRLKQAHNASSFHRAHANKSVNRPWKAPQQVRTGRVLSQDVPEPPTQHQSFEDEEENVIDLAGEDTPADWSQTQNTIQRKVDSGTYLYKQKPTLDDETAAAFAAADAELLSNAAPNPERHVTRPTNEDEDPANSHLYARIAELEAAAEEAKLAQIRIRQALEAKAGEIGIVRANAEKERKEHDRRIQALQRNHADDAAKHRQELEAGRKEREKMQTDNKFLQHDLAQEADRVKRINGPGHVKPVVERDTPRKTRRGVLGDGFDDDEVRSFSPSRSKENRRDSTPRVGSKRKRSAQDSPIPSLALARTSPLPRQDSMESVQAATPAVQLLPPVSSEGKDIRFIQRLMAYRPLKGRLRAIETLAQHQSPTHNNKTLSTVLMEALAMPLTSTFDSLPLRVASAMTTAWTACLEQQQYTSVRFIVDVIHFVLRYELPSRYNSMAEIVVPACLRSLELTTMPIARAHVNAVYAASIDRAAQAELSKLLDPYQITDLLGQFCDACTLSPESADFFWRTIDFASLMLLMHKALPMDRVISGLRMLHTSVTSETFGAIQEDQAQQEQREVDTVYRLTFAFFDIPSVPTGEPAYSDVEIAQFRTVLLDVLARLCEHDRGSLLLARHMHFIGQLAHFLDEQIRKLYTLAPSRQQFMDELATQPDAHDLVVETINTSMRILHHLMTKHNADIDLSEKFSVVPGGYHKFLISMTRLAFVDQPTVFEYGIADDVVEAAHNILDAFLTPEDGEAIAQALETPSASKSQLRNGIRAIDEDAMDTDPPD